jgi:7-cyano-7-deazaguanine reductase
MTQPARHLETFDNPAPERDYTIRMTMPEFTCLCPKTGQPDFATLKLEYVSYRDRGAFHEAVTNEILQDLAQATEPRFMRLTADFYVRGGIYTAVTAEHRKTGWVAPPPTALP